VVVAAQADAEDEPPAAEVVECHRLAGELVRAAAADGGDHRPDADALGDHGDRAERDPRIGDRQLGRRVPDVVPQEEAVEAALLGAGGELGEQAAARRAPRTVRRRLPGSRRATYRALAARAATYTDGPMADQQHAEPDEEPDAPPPIDPEVRARREAALQHVRKFGDPILKTRAREVERFDDALREEIRRMGQLMHDSIGIGLAAPQVGVSHRLLVYRVEHDSPVQALVNPRSSGPAATRSSWRRAA
jgi:hypothetical protein